MTGSIKRSALALIVLILNSSVGSQCQAKAAPAPKQKPSQIAAAGNPDRKTNTMHRLDFRVVGKNCALCLHRMQERIGELPGIIKVGVMQKKPFGAVVIYDSSKVQTDKIFEKAREGVPEVSFEDKIDVPIKTLPLVLVPAAAADGEDAARTKVDP